LVVVEEVIFLLLREHQVGLVEVAEALIVEVLAQEEQLHLGKVMQVVMA
jgi:hypothetical protein